MSERVAASKSICHGMGGSLEGVRVRSLLGNPLRLRRGETIRALDRTSRGAVIEFTGDDLRAVSK